MNCGSVLLTGGAGFIGSHTCLSLVESGYEVYVVDSLVNSSILSFQKVKEILSFKNINFENKLHFRRGDLRDISFLESVFQEAKNDNKEIRYTIHLAGLKSISESFQRNLEYWENNVIASINLIKFMDKYNCRTIVFSSSAAVYDISRNDIDEKCLRKPFSPYGASKLAVEKFLENIYSFSNENWQIIALRYFNPIGAHTSGLIGENPKVNFNNVFPLIIEAAFSKKKKLKIFGRDWDTRDGTPIRDYVHVMDIAYGHVLALNYIKTFQKIMIHLNLGSGCGTTVLELIRKFEKINNIEVPLEFMDRRKGDVEKLVADISLAYKLLEWKPNKSLEDMCKDGWKWKIQNPNGYECL